ncbi:hypothetical protein [Streptomyces sp. NPDC048603]
MTERQGELLLGEGRHSDADRIERERLAVGSTPVRGFLNGLTEEPARP